MTKNILTILISNKIKKKNGFIMHSLKIFKIFIIIA